MNRLGTAFLKNFDMRQCDDFLKTQNFKRSNYDFVKRLIGFLKINFLDHLM
jgi:hypothetical protein